MQGLGFRVWGEGFGVWGEEFGVGLWCRVWGSGLMVQESGCGVEALCLHDMGIMTERHGTDC